AQLCRACAQRTRQGAVAHGRPSRCRLAMGGKVMRTRSSVMLAVAVAAVTAGAVTVVTWRTAFAQAACNVDADCDDANPCTTDVCTNSVCSKTPVGNGTICDDANPSTASARCQAGGCARAAG